MTFQSISQQLRWSLFVKVRQDHDRPIVFVRHEASSTLAKELSQDPGQNKNTKVAQNFVALPSSTTYNGINGPFL